MNDPGFKLIDLGQTNAIIPSGIHVGPPHDFSKLAIPVPEPDWKLIQNGKVQLVSLCNPMSAKLWPEKLTDEIPSSQAASYLGSHPRAKVIRRDDATEYGDLLANVAVWLQIQGYRGIIVPLRGGVKPFVQLHVLTEMSFDHCLLPFTGGANKVNEEEIRFHLKAFLGRVSCKSWTKLAVVDTANSGHSALRLAETLLSLRKEWPGSEFWAVDFILFFDFQNGKKQCPPVAAQIRDLSCSTLSFRLIPCGVPSLLVEDWDEALGIKTIWKGDKTPSFQIVPSSGRLLIQESDGMLHEYEADRLDQLTDQILGKETSDAVVTHPTLTHVRDVWQKYVTSKSRDQFGGNS